MKKRMITMILATTMCASLLAGCGTAAVAGAGVLMIPTAYPSTEPTVIPTPVNKEAETDRARITRLLSELDQLIADLRKGEVNPEELLVEIETRENLRFRMSSEETHLRLQELKEQREKLMGVLESLKDTHRQCLEVLHKQEQELRKLLEELNILEKFFRKEEIEKKQEAIARIGYAIEKMEEAIAQLEEKLDTPRKIVLDKLEQRRAFLVEILNTLPPERENEEVSVSSTPVAVPSTEPTLAKIPSPIPAQSTELPTGTPGEQISVTPAVSAPSPTTEPTPIQTAEPAPSPTAEPTSVPTTEPTQIPTAEPGNLPTTDPTTYPLESPAPIG